MSINWYPGHMYKASKEIKEVLPQVDVIVEMLDARIPYSSANPVIANFSADKPTIKVLNKSDLADPNITQQWQDYWKTKNNIRSIALAPDQPEKIAYLFELIKKLVPHKNPNNLEKGGQTINAMIVGIPNVGKSTLINTLTGRKIAKTGNEPAVTKGQQRINLGNGICLFDTPGILWPKVNNPNSSYRLATTGAIKNTAMSYEDVAFFATEYLRLHYPNNLLTRYKLASLPDSELETLETIGLKRGCLKGGGRVDLEKVSKILLHELRDGEIGQISLETPDVMVKEEVEVQKILAQKAAEKEAKKALRAKKKAKRRR